MKYFTFWVLDFCHIFSFGFLSHFWFLSFVTFWVFELCHILSFWILSNFKFLNFVTFWVSVSCHVLYFWVLNLEILGFVTLNTGITQIGWPPPLAPLFWQSCINRDILSLHCDFFSLTNCLPLSEQILKKSQQPNTIWGPLKKEVSFCIIASNRIGQGSHWHLYAGSFTGFLETRFEDKQGEYVKPLLIEH